MFRVGAKFLTVLIITLLVVYGIFISNIPYAYFYLAGLAAGIGLIYFLFRKRKLGFLARYSIMTMILILVLAVYGFVIIGQYISFYYFIGLGVLGTILYVISRFTRTGFPREHSRRINVYILVILVIYGLFITHMFATGMFLRSFHNYIDDLNLKADETHEFNWTPENRGTITGVRLNGRVKSSGRVRLYLVDKEKRYLVLDSLSLKSPFGITGLFAGDNTTDGNETDPCVESWTCSEWSECLEGQQTRSCSDSNNCGTLETKPDETQECEMPETCTESWTCSDWSECSDSQQTRSCTDANSCGTTETKPNETQACIVPEIPENVTEPEENVTAPVLNETVNITENVTINITLPINVTENVTNVTASDNITNITLPENVTENITENITLPEIPELPEPVPEPPKLITEPITNITKPENITKPILELPEFFELNEFCQETCSLPNLKKKSYTLLVVVEDSEIEMDSISYSIVRKLKKVKITIKDKEGRPLGRTNLTERDDGTYDLTLDIDKTKPLVITEYEIEVIGE